MALTTFTAPTSGVDIVVGGTSISNEAHTIPVSSPYAIRLHRIPKVKSTGTSYTDNLYVSLADMALAGVSLTIAGSPATLTDNASPSAGQAYCQIIDSAYAYSTKIVFNSADAGKVVLVSYTGYMSLADAPWFTQLQDGVNRMETYAPCELLSVNEYSSGRFDDTVADSTSLIITASRKYLEFGSGLYTWATAAVSLSATGDCQVTAFTDVDGWKRIGLWLIVSTGVLAARITESAESTTQGALSGDPPDYAGEAYYCGYVDVQGDGTGAAGGIEDLPHTRIVTRSVVGRSSLLTAPHVTRLVFQTWGTPESGDLLDNTIRPHFDGEIVGCYLDCDDLGTNATDLVCDLQLSGSSLFASAGDQPTLAHSGGTFATDSTPTTDFTSLTFADDDYLQVIVDSCPSDCQHVALTLEVIRT